VTVRVSLSPHTVRPRCSLSVSRGWHIPADLRILSICPCKTSAAGVHARCSCNKQRTSVSCLYCCRASVFDFRCFVPVSGQSCRHTVKQPVLVVFSSSWHSSSQDCGLRATLTIPLTYTVACQQRRTSPFSLFPPGCHPDRRAPYRHGSLGPVRYDLEPDVPTLSW
jgi:hypothetical protein